jgi:hypothetical protein
MKSSHHLVVFIISVANEGVQLLSASLIKLTALEQCLSNEPNVLATTGLAITEIATTCPPHPRK